MFTMEITRLIERCRQGDADTLGWKIITTAEEILQNLGDFFATLRRKV